MMQAFTNFNPGPSQLYFTVRDHIHSALRAGVLSISHRSREFENIFSRATGGLRQLLHIPDRFHIFFAASATEIWERSIQNLVAHKSLHFVNGAFSKRYFEIATQLGRSPVKVEVPWGEGFNTPLMAEPNVELVALTHNETSTGVSMPLDQIAAIHQLYPDALISVDAVSSLPHPAFDFDKIDSLFFSVQKGFGLPAGLGVWIVNDRCLTKAEELQRKGVIIGTYHNLLSLHQHAKKNQTPETPNVLGIYLLEKVLQDFLRRGMDVIRKETEYKAAVLYQALDNHPLLTPFVKERAVQSKTVIIANCGEHTGFVSEALSRAGLQAGDGYGENKKFQLRFANFPAHSREQYEKLADVIESLK
jgi:phosphoserine aminotransferase